MSSEPWELGSRTAGTEQLGSVLRDYMEVTQRLQTTHETLQREVTRLRSEVESKDRELERRRRLAALGELAAGIAHEVRNPLGAIQLYSGLLRSQLGKRQTALELIEKIDAGIRAIECVVQDTLALAPRPGLLTSHSLRCVVDEAHDVCRATLEARRVSLEKRFLTEDVQVAADAAAIQRVLVNLIANAAQASPPKGTVAVQVGVSPDEQWVDISVLDEGSGLAEEIVDKIFDPFFTTKENGTGLGLTIAHRLVEAHGGSLTAHNRPAAGAEFVVRLPMKSGTDETRASTDRAGQPSAA